MMLLELTVIPLGGGRSISADLGGVIDLIDRSGLDYQVTAFGTLIEGTWEQLMELLKKCHEAMREKASRVLFLMRLDDYEDQTGLLGGAISSVEKALGRPVRK